MRVKHLSFTVKDVNKGWSFTAESTLLSQVTFCVVDLETTGGSPAECGITEIGAVKVRGGEHIGEFQSLVNPGSPIPPPPKPASRTWSKRLRLSGARTASRSTVWFPGSCRTRT